MGLRSIAVAALLGSQVLVSATPAVVHKAVEMPTTNSHGSLAGPITKPFDTETAIAIAGVVPGEERAVASTLKSRKSFLEDHPLRRITVINSTPYTWHRTHVSDYQIKDWEENWPEFIAPGVAFEFLSDEYGGKNRRETGAEVVYAIQGTCKPMSFEVTYNPTRAVKPDVRVNFKGELKTRWTPKGGQINLGTKAAHGGVNFVIAGTEDDFYSMDGPVGWMQEQIKDIGHYPLNEIVMPRSHHAGMSDARTGVGVVYEETTITQTRTPYDQMAIGGVRVLDFRPYMRRRGRFAAGHFSEILGLHHGMIGIRLQEIIDDINRFNKEHPGELIILDIHDEESWCGSGGGEKFRKLQEWMREMLYLELGTLEHRFKLPADAKDVHKMTLNDFVGDGKPAVLIHAPAEWAKDKRFPGVAGGYVTNRNFPRTAYWSDTNMGSTLVNEQAMTLKQRKASGRGGRIHDMQYVLRLASVQYVFPVVPLTILASQAWGRLYIGVWTAINDEVYPNWISLDRVQTEEAKILAMVINRCLVAGKCGKLRGKAPHAKEIQPKCKSKS